jgi:deoxyribodipyrimidine photo-lyase
MSELTDHHRSPDTVDAALVWFRRDLRLDDHFALSHALRRARRVYAVFVFDRELLDPLPRTDRRVEFIREALVDLDAALLEAGRANGVDGVRLIVRHGWPRDEIPALATELGVQAVVAAHDDDPLALARDAQVRGRLADLGVALHTGKDHVVFERDEILTAGGTPYGVFTPYSKAWLARLGAADLEPHPVRPHAGRLAPRPPGVSMRTADGGVPTLAEIGFLPTNLAALRLPTGSSGARELLADFLHRIEHYAEARDFPAVKGPSYLSAHLRFGTVSVRELAREAWHRVHAGSQGARVWLSELIWREFYHQVLHHHPRVVGAAFRPAYDRIRWEHGTEADAHFAAWNDGRTGYPIVDAAMAQINQTGYMHNRLRMIVASFLTKDLGLDWRRGEAAFAQKLLDFDLAANNGGWQWAASTGCDAQPYFRIFNPVAQSRKFDPQGRFIRRYLPALADLPDADLHAPWLAAPATRAAAGVELGRDYPQPIVDHDSARRRTLERYAVVRGG